MLKTASLVRWAKGRPGIASLLALSLLAGVGITTAVVLVRDPVKTPYFAGTPIKDVHDVPPSASKQGNHASGVYRPTATTWPAAGSATLKVGATAGRTPGLPVFAHPIAGASAGPASVAVELFDRRRAQDAGISGVVFTVGAHTGDGPVLVGLTYAGFAQVFGGNYAARLRLVWLPSCATTTPKHAECRIQTPLPSRNDQKASQVSAPITVAKGAAPMVIAATAAAAAGDGGGVAGDYSATSLSSAGTWSAGGNNGAFTYAYPIPVPPAPSELVPKVQLSYDSTTVDGRTAATQAQSSWVGDGWSTTTGFVEQSFATCSDNPGGSPAPVSTGDRCYSGPILTMSLNGSSTALIWDAQKFVWKPQADNGAVITRVTGSNNGTGTYNTDYWTVTERDGTVYQFGRNQLPGWTSGKPTTNSVDWTPVYAPRSTDPCYKPTFSQSVCSMAFRWNLDYVTDTNGNAMSYYYKQETNNYASFNGATKRSYIRDSYLDRIEYGFTDGNAYGTAPNRIVFGTSPRCVVSACAPLDATTKANWPDVPYDLVCSTGTCTSGGPSFFSTVRLTSITTQQYNTATARHDTVDAFAFAQTMPPTGDGLAPTLWLASITRTGADLSGGGSTGPITLPAITFDGAPLANRADTTNLQPYYRMRLASIRTETGSVITPTYTLVDPCATPVRISPASNTASCYPMSWTPSGYTTPILDWFNKYTVTKVTETDRPNAAPARVLSYVYTGGAAWHYDDNEIVKAKYRTYGQFRGYGDVQTLVGDGVNDRQTQSRNTYFRGMSKNNNGPVVTLTDSAGGVHEDHNVLAGRTLEVTNYLGNGGPIDNSMISAYWISESTALRSRQGLPALTANLVNTARTYSRQAITSGGTTTWRYHRTDHTYDASITSPTFGVARHTYEHTVPIDPAYDRCSTNTYAPVNPTANLVGLLAESESVSVACGGLSVGPAPSVPAAYNTLTAPATVKRPDQVVAHNRTYYDDENFTLTFPQPTAPTRGNPTMVRDARTFHNGAFDYRTTGRTKYNARGRPVESLDANGNRSTTDYITNSVGLVTGATKTNPLGHVVTSTIAPTRGRTLTMTDPNQVGTTQQFDALGRSTAVWLASRPTSSPANYRFSYNVSADGPVAVTSKTMNDSQGYITSTAIYDALLRPRQTQTTSPQSGRIVTDTFYDSRGWVTMTYDGWWDASNLPSTTLASATNLHAKVPSQTLNTFDGLGRVVKEVRAKNGVEVSASTAVYGGDRTTIVPPTGGTVATAVSDPLGRTVALHEYLTRPTVTAPPDLFTGTFTLSDGTKTTTTFGFDGHGRQSTTTSPTGKVWTRTYDLLGQVTGQHDPDGGDSTSRYDNNGNAIESVDSRQRAVSYTYDALNRRIGAHSATVENQTTANRTARWDYDNANNAVPNMSRPIGHVTTSTAYRNGSAYTVQARGFNQFGKSLGETVTIPSLTEDGLLGGTYIYIHQYTTNTGLKLRDVLPAKANLPAETVTYGYSGVLDLPSTLGGLRGYVDGTAYDAYGRVAQQTLGAQPNTASLTNLWDEHTGRLITKLVTQAGSTTTDIDKQDYDYDLAGNIVKQASTRRGATQPDETQCFRYDGLARLTSAWTGTDGCAATPTPTSRSTVGSGLGQDSAYWTAWTIDDGGNRTRETRYALTGGPDTTTEYTYDGNGASQPNTLTSTTTTTGSSTSTTSYAYDTAGNMTARNAGEGPQTLAWDNAGRLAGVTGGTAGDSTFVYDADGGLLLERNPTSTTLYLPGQQLVLDKSTGTVTGTRYYASNGGTVVRTGTAANAITFKLGDHHGTPMLYLDSNAQNPVWRQSTPYGAPRGYDGPWVDNRGFLDKPVNPATGLNQIGARNYDVDLGRFISLDPVFDLAHPQTFNGYSYANNSPVTMSDPTGLNPYDNETPCRIYDCGEDNVDRSESATDNATNRPDRGWLSPRKRQTIIDVKRTVCAMTTGCVKRLPKMPKTHPNYIAYMDITDNRSSCGDEGDVACEVAMQILLYGGDPASAYEVLRNPCDYLYCSTPLDMLLGGHTIEYPWPHAWVWDLVAGAYGARAGLGTGSGARGAGRSPSNNFPGGKGGRLMGRCAGNSFTPETLVLMADGSHKRIDQIQVGDWVITTEPTAGQTRPEQVAALIVGRGDKDLTDVTVNDQNGPRTVTATAGHPFWVDHDGRPETRGGQWLSSGSLTVGQWLTTHDRRTVQITAIRLHGQQQTTVHNLTINELHTYYVLAGKTPVLVHNDNGIPSVDNARLQNIVNALFHGVGNPNQVGDGSAMAAANSEALGGAQVEGRNHLGSTAQLRSSLVNFLTKDTIRERGGKKVPVVRSARDIQVANSLISAIDDAHAGKYAGLGGYDGLGGC